MKKTLATATLITLAGLGLGTVAIAGQHGPKPSFEMLDTNGDGSVTMEELQAKGAAKFAETDLNGDGFLDAGEMLQAAKEHAGKRGEHGGRPMPGAEKVDEMAGKILGRMDSNGDGKISKAEAKGPFARAFDKIDTDGDGMLDSAELKASVLARAGNHGQQGEHADQQGEHAGEQGEHGGQQGEHAGQQGEHAGEQGEHAGKQGMSPEDRIAKMIAHADTDGDGKLSLEEITGAKAGKMFQKIDADGDGAVTKAEWDAAKAAGHDGHDG